MATRIEMPDAYAKPPMPSAEDALDRAWDKSADEFRSCSLNAAAHGRAGTIWVDVFFPSPRTSRTRLAAALRASSGLRAADTTCVRQVVLNRILPAVCYGVDSLALATKPVPLGTTTSFLPPLSSFLPMWLELMKMRFVESDLRGGWGSLPQWLPTDACWFAPNTGSTRLGGSG